MWPGIPRGAGEPGEYEGTCIIPLPDGGKICSSSSQCSGTCLAVDGSQKTGRGQCSRTNYNSGCRAFVEKGKASQVICSD